MLLLTAFIWGSAFVAQSTGMDYLRPFTFNGVRSLIGGVVLLPVLLFWRPSGGRSPQVLRQTWRGGLCCGVILFAASSFQQFGIAQTTVGKASFISALYIVLGAVGGAFVSQAACAADMGGRLRWARWACTCCASPRR